MAIDFSNLNINRIITHEVLKRDKNRASIEPKYSSQLTFLDNQGKNTLRERVIVALGNDSHSIEVFINDSSEQSVSSICSQILNASDDEYIELSKKIALKLAESQKSRGIPGGIIVVFDGTIGRKNLRYIGIIKAETHSGFMIDTEKLYLQYLSELVLTPQQKLYKIGFFVENINENPDNNMPLNDFEVIVHDQNIVKGSSGEAAQYFYESFLGCSFSPTSRKLTGDFFYKTKEFIDSLNVDSEKRYDLHSALYTYLKIDQNPLIEVASFAKKYLEIEAQDQYVEFMESQGLPSNAISKDLTNIDHRMKQRRIVFQSQIKLIAPPDSFTERIKLFSSDDKELINELIEDSNYKTVILIDGYIQKED